MSFNPCHVETSLTDTDLAAVIRSAADGDGMSGPVKVSVAGAACMLEAGHSPDCGSWIASLDDDGTTTTAWLRWNINGPAPQDPDIEPDCPRRRVDWLVDCRVPGCILFRGHPGACRPLTDDAGEPTP